jgi:parallel beta-helix repeat protein
MSSPRSKRSMKTLRTPAALGGALGLALLSVAASGGPASAAGGSGTTVPTAPVVSTAEGNQEAAVVAAEDRRLVELRAVTSTSQAKSSTGQSPYRVETGSTYTLVLTPQTAPYTFADLLELEPETLVLQPDGSYLLSEDIYVERGATLDLATTTGLTLKMQSDAEGFASIVSYGGDIIVTGTAAKPVRIESWNPQIQTPQTDLTNGRSYIREIGGQLRLSYVDASNLGFWSGDTGGIAMTGTNRPSAGSTTYSGTVGNSTPLNSNQVTTSPVGSSSGSSSEFYVPGMSYVSAKIDHTNISDDAFGLYFSTAQGVAISDSAVTGSLVEGIDLHRLTTEVEIQDVSSNQNDGPGFDISRAAQQVQIADCTADYNLGNGYTVNGQPISQGASASGESLGSYGNNSIGSSTAQGNSHYGIEVQGGLNITLQKNTIIGNQMGIVVTKATDTVTISGNVLEQQDREGISLIDGVSQAAVTGNQIQGAATGIYVRDSVVELEGNAVSGASLHAITLIGSDAGSVVKGNTLGGAGVSALDTARVTGKVTLGPENAAGWDDTVPLLRRLEAVIRPLTLIWLGIFTVLIVAAYRNWRTRNGKGRRHDRRRAALAPGRHPYTNQFVMAIAPPKTLDEVLAESAQKMAQARAETAERLARRARPAAEPAPAPVPVSAHVAEPAPGKERAAFESVKPAKTPEPVKAQAPVWTPPPRTPEPAVAAASAASAAPAPESAYQETTLLPVVLDQEPAHPAPETLVLAGSLGELREESDDSLDFPSFGEISGGTGRRRARPAMPDPAETEERQW